MQDISVDPANSSSSKLASGERDPTQRMVDDRDDLEEGEEKAKARGSQGISGMSGRTLKLWQLKLKSRLGECWRLRKAGNRGGSTPYVATGALVLAFLFTLSFLWRISDVDPSYCKGTTSRDEVAKEKYTVVVNTFKRPERLEKSIRHYSRCKGVDAIRIVWSESSNPPRELADASALPVIFDVHVNNSINNRFRPLDDVKTEGIFNVDDDILVDCSSLYFGFQTWRTARDTLVGFNPRIHSKSQEGECKYNYKQWWHVWWGGSYSIVLTKAAFSHHKYFREYTENLPRSVWDHVHKNK